MIIAAMSPDSYKTGLTIEWLSQYFDTFGDKQPNGDKIKLSINTKRELYEEYYADMQLMDPQAVVSESSFETLWNGLFPSVRIRSWVNIPGKCNICMEIDKLRRKPNKSEATRAALKHAHLLHRGGLFMLERQR
jgi:hypothetical protein